MIKRQIPLTRGGDIARRKPLRKRSPKWRANRKRNASERRHRTAANKLRIYGSHAFRDYLHRTPCLWCHSPFVEQAHMQGNGGTGRKGDWRGTGPLCTHCHDQFDRRSSPVQWFTADDRVLLAGRLAKFHAGWRE